MADLTNRLGLPLLAVAQAQKEMTHNEALALIDIAVQPVVQAVGLDSPPVAPIGGQCWIVGANASGVWAGQAGALAAWTAGGWRFIKPFEGMQVWSNSDQTMARYESASWLKGVLRGSMIRIDGTKVVGVQQLAIASPSSGVVVDAEARTSISAILSALRAHGLIAIS